MFGTPEYIGGVAGPTDFLTLIAEVPLQNIAIFDSRPSAGKIWIAPESARSRLSDSFLSMLKKQKNATVDFSARADCRALNATPKQTDEVVNGFACAEGGTHAGVFDSCRQCAIMTMYFRHQRRYERDTRLRMDAMKAATHPWQAC